MAPFDLLFSSATGEEWVKDSFAIHKYFLNITLVCLGSYFIQGSFSSFAYFLYFSFNVEETLDTTNLLRCSAENLFYIKTLFKIAHYLIFLNDEVYNIKEAKTL